MGAVTLVCIGVSCSWGALVMNVVDWRWLRKGSGTVLSEFRGERSLFFQTGAWGKTLGFRCVEVMTLNIILYYFSLRGTVIFSTSVTWPSTTLPIPICILSVGGHNPHFTDEEVGFSLSIWHSLDLSLAVWVQIPLFLFQEVVVEWTKKQERQAQIVQWVLQDYGKERWRVKASEGHMVIR